jgi:hypothetical protein
MAIAPAMASITGAFLIRKRVSLITQMIQQGPLRVKAIACCGRHHFDDASSVVRRAIDRLRCGTEKPGRRIRT